MRSLLFVSALLVVSSLASAFYTPPSCSGYGGGGTNCLADKPYAISVLTQNPTFVNAVKNGKRYLGGSGNDTFHIAHLYSETDDLYDMGFALGQMFPQEIKDMWTNTEPWLVAELESASQGGLPDWLAKLVVYDGASAILEALFDVTYQFTPQDYIREWQGIADGANTTLKTVAKITLFPQLTKAACTILLADKNATREDLGAIHLRALDFAPGSLISDFASVVVYHYKTKPQLANFGWIGMTGILTGMNDLPMSVSEKAWGGHDSPILGFPYGLPWMQMLRRSLEFGSLDLATEYIQKATHPTASSPGNTVSIHAGYASQATKQLAMFEVGYNYSKTFGSFTPGTDTKKHPDFENVIYFTKNSDPHTTCVADMLHAQYGTMSAEWMAMSYSPNDMTGDTQVAAFDLKGMKVWYANSRKTGSSGPLCAYYRQRTVLDMKAVFAEKQE